MTNSSSNKARLTFKETHLIVCLLQAEKARVEYDGNDAFIPRIEALIDKIVLYQNRIIS